MPKSASPSLSKAEVVVIAKAKQRSLANAKRRARIEKAMKIKAEVEVAKKVVILEGHASEEIPKEVIIESLKTMIGEEELKKATASDQVLEEVVLDAIIVVFEDE
ncbi:hypothetical protein GYH30_015913 [Glycine max]|nr:hypothetical protein GYH30_015913 [Glycine max]